MKNEIYSMEDFVKLPLYKKLCMTAEKTQQRALYILKFDGGVDQYCVECDQNSTFIFKDELWLRPSRSDKVDVFSVFSKPGSCARNSQHRTIFHFQVSSDGLQKIGQYPSIADVVSGDIQKYRKVFNSSEMNGLMKAVGLFSHGIGAGAFIYLRKIFEAQVKKAHDAATAGEGWDEKAYKRMRMAERIQALKSHLPELLVSNSTLYSILSEHLHEGPSEDECLKNFNVVLQGIFVIADEQLTKLEKANRLASFNKSKQALLDSRKVGTKV